MDIRQGPRKLLNLARINILLGKNASGKSTILRDFEANKQNLPNLGQARYITPERGGELTYLGQLETNESNQPGWGDAVRRSNRFENFRQMSVTQFRRLETLVLRKIEQDLSSAPILFQMSSTSAPFSLLRARTMNVFGNKPSDPQEHV